MPFHMHAPPVPRPNRDPRRFRRRPMPPQVDVVDLAGHQGWGLASRCGGGGVGGWWRADPLSPTPDAPTGYRLHAMGPPRSRDHPAPSPQPLVLSVAPRAGPDPPRNDSLEPPVVGLSLLPPRPPPSAHGKLSQATANRGPHRRIRVTPPTSAVPCAASTRARLVLCRARRSVHKQHEASRRCMFVQVDVSRVGSLTGRAMSTPVLPSLFAHSGRSRRPSSLCP